MKVIMNVEPKRITFTKDESGFSQVFIYKDYMEFVNRSIPEIKEKPRSTFLKYDLTGDRVIWYSKIRSYTEEDMVFWGEGVFIEAINKVKKVIRAIRED